MVNAPRNIDSNGDVPDDRYDRVSSREVRDPSERNPVCNVLFNLQHFELAIDNCDNCNLAEIDLEVCDCKHGEITAIQ